MWWLMRELRDWWTGIRDPESRAFDQEYGVETVWFDLFNYEPSLPSVVRASLDALDIPFSDYTFVDLGSGKGRALFLAAERPFARVVGIEHRSALHRQAHHNLARLEGRVNAPIELILGDAATVPLPDGCLLYTSDAADE